MRMQKTPTSASPALKRLAAAFRYRKRSVTLYDQESATLTGGYWSGGSRAQYGLYDLATGKISPLTYPTNPPQFGGTPAPTIAIEPGTVVVRGGTSDGKPAFLSIYGPDAIARLGS